MKMEILKNFSFSVDKQIFMEQLKIIPDSEDEIELEILLKNAMEIAKPKAIYLESFIEEKRKNTVKINGVEFESKLLRKNLDKVEKIFPFIVTCGNELDSKAFDKRDFLKEYWWDRIKQHFLDIALNNLIDHLEKRFFLNNPRIISPGTGDYGLWSIEQQKNLFSLFKGEEKLIGVKLTESYLMIPNKSLSGIIFTGEKDFRSCKVCHRKNCPSRSAPFDKNLWKSLKK